MTPTATHRRGVAAPKRRALLAAGAGFGCH
jgi:hypothetical protein